MQCIGVRFEQGEDQEVEFGVRTVELVANGGQRTRYVHNVAFIALGVAGMLHSTTLRSESQVCRFNTLALLFFPTLIPPYSQHGRSPLEERESYVAAREFPGSSDLCGLGRYLRGP